MSALAIRQSESAFAWWGIPYNPYGVGPYLHAFALPFFDFEHEVMIGEEFWNFVGGEGAYEELLEVYREVGEEFADRPADAHGEPLDGPPEQERDVRVAGVAVVEHQPPHDRQAFLEVRGLDEGEEAVVRPDLVNGPAPDPGQQQPAEDRARLASRSKAAHA